MYKYNKYSTIHSNDRTGKSLCSFTPQLTLTTAQSFTNSGFSAILLAILGLSARCVGSGDALFSQIAPQTGGLQTKPVVCLWYDICHNDYMVYSGYASHTKFNVRVRHERDLL